MGRVSCKIFEGKNNQLFWECVTDEERVMIAAASLKKQSEDKEASKSKRKPKKKNQTSSRDAAASIPSAAFDVSRPDLSSKADQNDTQDVSMELDGQSC